MSNSTRLPVPQQADAYLRALQNDLAAKRSAAFSRDQPHGPQPRYVAPIRSNAPRMGADGYEPHSPAPVEGWRRVLVWAVAVALSVACWYGLMVLLPVVGDLIKRIGR